MIKSTRMLTFPNINPMTRVTDESDQVADARYKRSLQLLEINRRAFKVSGD